MVGYSWRRFSYLGHSQNYVNSLGFVNANGDNGFTYDNGGYYMDVNTHNSIGEVVNSAPESRWGNPLRLCRSSDALTILSDDTYLLAFTLRDGISSRFAKNNRWGLFPLWPLAGR